MMTLSTNPARLRIPPVAFQSEHTRLKYQHALNILTQLHAHGFEAFLCGGCVRDIVMHLEPKDFDIATSAAPQQIEDLFPRRADLVGKSFGVVIVRDQHDPHIYTEVATFRIDGPYLNGRRPTKVTFATAQEDVLRRDFTCNALFLDTRDHTVLDWTGGLTDIQNKLIRCVGDPTTRFREDRLRLLRAIRFSVQLGFEIEQTTWNALCKEVEGISTIAPERIRDELNKSFCSPQPARALDLLYDSGILAILLPEICALRGCQQPPQFHPEGDVYNHLRLMLSHLPHNPDPRLVWAVLLHDIGKPATFSRDADGRIRFNGHELVGAEIARRILTRLRFCNDDIDYITTCVRNHMAFKDAPQMRPATLKKMLARPTFATELELHRIDCLGCHGDLSIYQFLLERQQELSREQIKPPPLLNGHDVMAFGIPSGPLVGKILNEAYDLQLENAFPNRQAALDWLKNRLALPNG